MLANISKRTRIHGFQKRRLVGLVERFFISRSGRNFKVNGVAIGQGIWRAFAEELNSIGPPKSANEWRVSFNAMKSRVRKTMLMVFKNGGGVDDSLSYIDQKIYQMFPHESNNTDECLNENMEQSDTESQEIDLSVISSEESDDEPFQNCTEFPVPDSPVTLNVQEELRNDNEIHEGTFNAQMIARSRGYKTSSKPSTSIQVKTASSSFDKTTGGKSAPNSRYSEKIPPTRSGIDFDEALVPRKLSVIHFSPITQVREFGTNEFDETISEKDYEIEFPEDDESDGMDLEAADSDCQTTNTKEKIEDSDKVRPIKRKRKAKVGRPKIKRANTSINKDDLYSVEKILGERIHNGKVQYLAQWRHPSKEKTWEPVEHFHPLLIEAIEKLKVE